MTPTILARSGRPFMVTGSPGGPRIITATLLTILHVIVYGVDASEAVAAPRFHHQWLPDELEVEPPTPADVLEGLRRRGHRVRVLDREWASAQVIVVDAESGLHTGASDPRSDGLAEGP
jgi:gamma-glutamyltranspeptidase/glutathione hydrolase